MAGKGTTKGRRGAKRSALSPRADEGAKNEEVTASPLGPPDQLQEMVAEIAMFNQQTTTRFTELVKYIISVEGLNNRLEGRVDRSLQLAEVKYFKGFSSDNAITEYSANSRC